MNDQHKQQLDEGQKPESTLKGKRPMNNLIPTLFKRIKASHERAMTISTLKRLDRHVLNDLTIDDPKIKAILRKNDLLD